MVGVQLFRLKMDNKALITQAEEEIEYLENQFKFISNLEDNRTFYGQYGMTKQEKLLEIATEIKAQKKELAVYKTKQSQIDKTIAIKAEKLPGMYDEAVEALGIKSAPTLLKEEKEGKADYTTERAALKEDYTEMYYGYIDEDTEQLPIGKMVLEYSEAGYWTWGKTVMTRDMLQDMGFYPAKVMNGGTNM